MRGNTDCTEKRVSGLEPSSSTPKIIRFGHGICFHLQVESWKYVLPLETANVIHWRTGHFILFDYWTMDKVQKPTTIE
jgi:hypothetical protein